MVLICFLFFFFFQIITIFAFATVAGFVGRFEFTVKCQYQPDNSSPSSRVVKGEFNYPFNNITLYKYASEKQLCRNESADIAKKDTLDMNYKSEAEYFVFTGVVSMLFVLVAAVYYVFFEDRAKDATSTDVGLFSFPLVVRIFAVISQQLPVTNNPGLSLRIETGVALILTPVTSLLLCQ